MNFNQIFRNNNEQNPIIIFIHFLIKNKWIPFIPLKDYHKFFNN